MNSALTWIGSLLAVLLAALFAVPYFIDWNGYRDVFEQEASRMLGRDVRVGGDVSLSLLPSPYVRFEKIRIANKEPGEPLFRADHFTMWLSVPPLLRGVFEAQEVTLQRPVLRLSFDADGRGNWDSLSFNAGGLPFAPSDVTFDSVKISKGSVIVQQRDGRELARIDNVNGELNGEALEGPYKFAGTFAWEGEHREIRFATAPPDADSAVRFKTTVRVTASENTYSLDGRAADLLTIPKYAGDLKARMTLASTRPSADETAKTQAAPGQTPVNITARVEGDGRGAALDTIAVSFDIVGQPQLISGEAKVRWQDALALDLSLSSRWLDFDKLTGAPEGVDPLTAAQGLLAVTAAMLPDEARTTAHLTADQINLGGDAVSGLAIKLSRTDGPLRIEQLRAEVPGNAKLEAQGVVSTGEKPSFTGAIGLRGTSLPRLLQWSGAGVLGEGPGESPFAIHGDLAISSVGLHLTQATAEFAGSSLSGEVNYTRGPNGRLTAVIDGRRIDVDQIWPNFEFASLFAAPPPNDGEAYPDLKVVMTAAELRAGGQTLRDVRAEIALEDGRVSIPALAFGTSDGLSLEAEGAVADAATKPAGALRFVLAASSPASLEALSTFLGGGQDWSKALARAAGLPPLRLAGTLDFGSPEDNAVRIALDGTANGGRLVAGLRLDGGLESWREGGAEGSVDIDAADVDGLLRRLAGGTPSPAAARPGRVAVAWNGRPADGLMLTAAIEAEGLALAYDGTVKIPADDAAAELAGALTLRAASTRELFALAGLNAPPSLGAVPLEGSIHMTRRDRTLTLKPGKLTIGSQEVTGNAMVTQRDNLPAEFTAGLHVSEGSIPALLTAFLGTSGEETAGLVESGGIWPREPFDFAALGGAEGRMTIAFGKLELATGLALERAVLEAKIEPGRVSVTKLDGHGLGGTLGSAFAIEKAPAGVSLKGALRLDGIHMASLAKPDPAHRSAAGTANIELSFAGQALSPDALVSALTGSGEIELEDARLTGLTSSGLLATADAVLLNRTPGKGEGLLKALRATLAKGELDLGSRKIPVEIVDGAARIKDFSVETDKGRTSASITVDLATFDVDSEWRIEPKAAEGSRRPPLPPVSIVYVGPLAGLASLEPRISTEALERELAVRRIERDVDEFERLRKEDEARARAETERQKALEADKADPADAAPSPAGEEQGTAVHAPATAEGWAGDTAVPAAPPAAQPEAPAGTSNTAPARASARKRRPAFDPWSQLDSSRN